MSPKLKSENYQGLAGINAKFSPYVTGYLEFLDIQNMDFQMPGALTQRWGSTMYVGQTLSGKITALGEFSRLDGTSFVFFGSSGALYFGATTGRSQGMSFFGQTAFVSYPNFAPEMTDVQYDASAHVAFVGQNAPYLGLPSKIISNQYNISIFGQTLGTNHLSAVSLNNYLFACNGSQFFKFDGATTTFIGSPPVTAQGVTVRILNSAGSVGVGASGSYAFYGSWVNDRGFEGQIWPICCINAGQANSASLGGTFISAEFNVFMPSQYNLKSLNIYSYYSGSTLTLGSTQTWSALPYAFLANYPVAGASIIGIISNVQAMRLVLGTTVGGQTALVTNAGALPDPIVNSYYPLGFTSTVGTFAPNAGLTLGFAITPFIPQFLEVYKNTLFLAGFSSAPSFTVYSDPSIGEPEGYSLESGFEVRSNDGDVIVGMKSYNSRLYYFKRNSFHVLTGDTNANFQLNEITNQYGAVNNRCIIIYDENEKMMFLDTKGLISFNGAQSVHASIKMQPYFDRMNYSAALTEACMVHDKLRNQVLCSIPIDGSSINNITIVYDYAADSWTTQIGVAPSVLARIQGRNNNKNAFYGSYSGMISWYGPSFTSDSGVGFTNAIKTRFNHEMGDSTQKMFRRLFLNVDPPSATLSIPVNFYQDYGSSTVLQSTLVIGDFQQRLEFGICAKALAFEMHQAATNVPLRIYGYTLEERLQRSV